MNIPLCQQPGICNICELKDKNYQLLFQAKTKEELEVLRKDSNFSSMAKKIIAFNEFEKEYERMEMVENMWTLEDEIKFQKMEAHREGRLSGKQQGLKEGEKIGLLKAASNMLLEGIPIELIMKATHLSQNEIQNYRKIGI